MTIPMARSLLRQMDAVDGYRDAARMIVEGILDIAVAGGLVKRKSPNTSNNTSAAPAQRRQPDEGEAILVDDLRAFAQQALLAEGWQPPPQPNT